MSLMYPTASMQIQTTGLKKAVIFLHVYGREWMSLNSEQLLLYLTKIWIKWKCAFLLHLNVFWKQIQTSDRDNLKEYK